MQGNINCSGNTITDMAAVPAMPNGAAPAQWVLNQIAAVSLYQGTWDADTNVPDLTQLSERVNGYTWFAITTSPSGVVVSQPIPGLQGQTVFNGDTIIYSTIAGAFQAIHAGGLTLAEADGRYVQLAGSQMSGALLLNANATQPLQAATYGQLEAAVANTVTPDAPADGQAYLRVGVGAPANRWVPGLPLAGGILTGSLTLSGNAVNPLNAVPLQQVNSLITAATTGFLPLAGGQMTGLMQLSGNATANLNPVPFQQLTSVLGAYAPISNPTFTGTVTIPAGASIAGYATTAAMNTALANYLPLAGGTLTGGLTVGGALVASNTLNVTGGISATTGTTALGAVTTNASMSVGGAGIQYNGIGGAGHIGFSWVNTSLELTVDGTSVGASVVSPGGTGGVQVNSLGVGTNATSMIAVYGAGSLSWATTPSDRRLKSNIEDASADALALVNQVPIHSLDFNNPFPGAEPQHWDFSMIADEIEGPIPPAFMEAPTNGYQSINPLPLCYVLWRAVQQLAGAVAALKDAAA